MLNRVAVVRAGWLPTQQANGLQTIRMCEAFTILGLQVTLYYLPSPIFKDDIMQYYDVKTPFTLKKLPRVLLPWRKNFRLETWMSVPSFVHAFLWSGFATSLLYREKADFYFVREPMLAVWLGHRGLPTVLEMHDISMGRERTFIRCASRQSSIRLVVAVSEYLRVDLIQQFGVPSEKIIALHSGVELERFSCPITKELARQQLGLAPDAVILVYAGQLYPEKGPDTLVRAAAMLQDVRILIVGGGTISDNERLRRLVEDVGVKNVMLTGFVSPSKIPIYLKSADILVLPQSAMSTHSTYYTSPLKLFEYMASDRPIVASRLPVLQEILTDEKNVLFYTADDPVALADTLKRLISNTQLASSISNQAYRDLQHYTWTRRAERILQYMSLS